MAPNELWVRNSFLNDSFRLGIARWEPTCDLLVVMDDVMHRLAEKRGFSDNDLYKIAVRHEWFHRVCLGTPMFRDLFAFNAALTNAVSYYDYLAKKMKHKELKTKLLWLGIATKRIRLESRSLLEALSLYGAEHIQPKSGDAAPCKLLKSIRRGDQEIVEFEDDLNQIHETYQDDTIPWGVVYLALCCRIGDLSKLLHKMPAIIDPKVRFRFFIKVLRTAHEQGIHWSELTAKKRQIVHSCSFHDPLRKRLLKELIMFNTMDLGGPEPRGADTNEDLFPNLFRLFERNSFRKPAFTFMLTINGRKGKLHVKKDITKDRECLVLLKHLNLCELTYRAMHYMEPICFLETIGQCRTSCSSCFFGHDLENAREMGEMFRCTEISKMEKVWKELANAEHRNACMSTS